MRSLLLTDQGPQVQTAYPTPRPQAGEALVRVRMAGICATDLELLRGYKGGYRGVLGHEFVGEVVASPGQELWIGRRVVGELNVGCGDCALCRQGLGKHCRQRSSLGIIRRDGAFADYLTLPVSNLHPVPPQLPDEVAVFTEPLAAALQILEQAPIAPHTRVYVLGDGRLGLLAAQILARTGCDLTAIGRHPQKLAILARRGIPTAIVDNPADLVGLLAHPAQVVVEATGTPQGFDLARQLVRPAGTLVLKSTFAAPLDAFDVSSLVVDEITLIGSRCGPFAPALRLLAAHAVDVSSLVQACYSLDQGLAALEHASRKGILKVLLQMGTQPEVV